MFIVEKIFRRGKNISEIEHRVGITVAHHMVFTDVVEPNPGDMTRQFPDCERIRSSGVLVPNPDSQETPLQASEIDGSDKYTLEVRNCIVVVVNGYSGQIRNMQSLLVHVPPEAVMYGNEKKFASSYSALLRKLRSCVDSGIDVVMAGGTFHDQSWDESPYSAKTKEENYLNLAATLIRCHAAVLRTDTRVLQPRMYRGEGEVYFDNQTSTMHVLESGQLWRRDAPITLGSNLANAADQWRKSHKIEPVTWERSYPMF